MKLFARLSSGNHKWVTGGLILSLIIAVGLVGCATSVERSGGTTPTSVPTTPTPSPTQVPTATGTPVPSPTPMPVVSPTAAPTVTPTPTFTGTPTAMATAGPTPETTPTPLPIGSGLRDDLFLQITNFPKESVVRTNTVDLAGSTSPDALVSVNGVLVDVGVDGEFTATVTLKEEPNLVEVIASDFRGNQVSAVLTIIYIP